MRDEYAAGSRAVAGTLRRKAAAAEEVAAAYKERIDKLEIRVKELEKEKQDLVSKSIKDAQ